MKSFWLTIGVGLLAWCATMVSCVGTAPMKEVRLVDSLNWRAYTYRYKDVDSSRHAALRAYSEASLYKQGKAEAANSLGFCAFMRMDFEEAGRYHKEVYALTKNELELLVADIGLMKICQRTASNKEFYDYRNSALRRMKRIAEDENLFVDRYEKMRLDYARSEFYIVSAIYHYYLQQRPEALADMTEVPAGELEADTSQLLYYHYIMGSASLTDGSTADERRLHDFDQLYDTWRLASQQGYVYFEANSLQGLAALMASPEGYDFFNTRRPHALTQLGAPVNDTLALRLGQTALQKFRQYNDRYQIAGAYVSIAKYLNAHDRCEEALDSLNVALTYADLQKVPDCVSRIREQLSVTYAGLGMKKESDENRNIYLDILDETRQDREQESRYQALEQESRQLNGLLALVLAGFVVVILAFWFFNKRSRERAKAYFHRMQLLLDLCQKITVSIPADAQTEEDIVEALETAVSPDLEQLFGVKGIRIADGTLVFPRRIKKEEKAVVQVVSPYIRWALDNGKTSISLVDEQRRLEKQRYVYEQHIAENKRQNIVKKACLSVVSGIHPYIDRIINEVHKLVEKGYISDARIKAEKYQYIDELVTTINEYNDILALWIKMKQGTLSLNIETFSLNELFELLRKGNRAFELKRQQLEVQPTDARVKADKALTLFMINTLAENARKYTPQGGRVKVYARQEADYVEISVEDTGCGLSPEDVARIVGEKVYDSKAIGLNDAADKEELLKNKGSGFGLMNCKGIIEKYRKTDDLFRVCLFQAESTLGKGSRFYFRLPAGIRKAVTMVCLLLSLGMLSCQRSGGSLPDAPQASAAAADSLQTPVRDEFEKLLDMASDYANEAYFCNIDGSYEDALAYIDLAMQCLNAHYLEYASPAGRCMTLTGDDTPAELDWWDELFNSDFHVILDIRNEAAVAFLALKQWDGYSYNNRAYTVLYKLLGEDQSLEEYCNQLERSTNNKMVGILLAVVLLVALLLGFYIFNFRKRMVNRWNLEQVLEINEKVFNASLTPAAEGDDRKTDEEETLKKIPLQTACAAFDGIDELLGIDCLGIAVCNDAAGRLEYSFCTAAGGQSEAPAPLKPCMEQSYTQHTYVSQAGVQALPLVVDAGSDCRYIGVLGVMRSEGTIEQPADRLFLELIARYVAIVAFNAVVKRATQYRDIEDAQDEARRASFEESQLHVQNLVLDNCLSTIKHETVYYPNKVKQLVGKLRAGRLTEAEERETISAIGELIDYYKGIFTILNSCAQRQLEEVTFRRSAIPVSQVMEAAEKYFRKAGRQKQTAATFSTEAADCQIVGDRNQLRFLVESLIDEALSAPDAGALRLTAAADGAFVRFSFTDTRRPKSCEELNQLFYPALSRMKTTTGGAFHGTEYLVCKQIIREHDEYAGRRGCRINAEPAEAGFTVYFTIPKK